MKNKLGDNNKHKGEKAQKFVIAELAKKKVCVDERKCFLPNVRDHRWLPVA
jgi:hypothetical protein